MTPISGDLFKVGIDDARARHAAIVNLILFTDTQALGLLRLLVPLGIATASGAAASLAGSQAIPHAAGVALAATTLVLAVASWLCLEAMRTAKINLPGRGAEFWTWSNGIDPADVFAAYMENLAGKQAANNALNARTAAMLAWAKRCTVASPAVAIAIGAMAAFARI